MDSFIHFIPGQESAFLDPPKKNPQTHRAKLMFPLWFSDRLYLEFPETSVPPNMKGNLLKLAPRPMVYAWGFRDWTLGSFAELGGLRDSWWGCEKVGAQKTSCKWSYHITSINGLYLKMG